MKHVLLAFALVLLVTSSHAGTGDHIPTPQPPLAEAVKLAEKAFLSNYEDLVAYEEAPIPGKKDFFVSSVLYTDRHGYETFDGYSWVITLIHPILAKHRFTYQVKSDRSIRLLRQEK